MNVDTGELRNINEEVENLLKLKEEGFEVVPKHLQKHAKKELGNKKSVMVDMSLDTPLTQWAHSKRKSKAKAKRKMAKKSRKINR